MVRMEKIVKARSNQIPCVRRSSLETAMAYATDELNYFSLMWNTWFMTNRRRNRPKIRFDHRSNVEKERTENFKSNAFRAHNRARPKLQSTHRNMVISFLFHFGQSERRCCAFICIFYKYTDHHHCWCWHHLNRQTNTNTNQTIQTKKDSSHRYQCKLRLW